MCVSRKVLNNSSSLNCAQLLLSEIQRAALTVSIFRESQFRFRCHRAS